jgi:hypothetical protein
MVLVDFGSWVVMRVRLGEYYSTLRSLASPVVRPGPYGAWEKGVVLAVVDQAELELSISCKNPISF